jgi:SAM-dependent methyltransferase
MTDAVARKAGDPDAAWQHFLAYLRAAPPLAGVQEMFRHYQRTLGEDGLSQQEAERRVGMLLGLMRERPDAWPLLFDRIYASPAPNVVGQPNAFLMAMVAGVSPGRAIEIAVGQGRNAVALAERGWEVTGIDVSEAGLASARTAAAKAGVGLTLLREDDGHFDFGSERWDLVAIIYGPVSVTDPSYARRIDAALRPGGLVVVESFASPASAPRRKPVDIDPGHLLQAFSGFRILRFEDFDGVSEWDPQPTRLVRMAARKEPQPGSER